MLRREFTAAVGGDLSLPVFVSRMVGSENTWKAVASFCEQVMLQKEEAAAAAAAAAVATSSNEESGKEEEEEDASVTSARSSTPTFPPLARLRPRVRPRGGTSSPSPSSQRGR